MRPVKMSTVDAARGVRVAIVVLGVALLIVYLVRLSAEPSNLLDSFFYLGLMVLGIATALVSVDNIAKRRSRHTD